MKNHIKEDLQIKENLTKAFMKFPIPELEAIARSQSITGPVLDASLDCLSEKMSKDQYRNLLLTYYD